LYPESAATADFCFLAAAYYLLWLLKIFIMNRLTSPYFIRRSLLILAAPLLMVLSAHSQGIHLSHTTIFVVDLAKSAGFYEHVLGLKKIAEPFHDGKHVWFRVADHSQLHVVAGAKEDIPHDINIHLAFSVPDLAAFTKRLEKAHVKYGNWAQNSTAPQLRPDNVKQVYLQDPDGYWIEINDDTF
jgi:lactoylglutathione lyase